MVVILALVLVFLFLLLISWESGVIGGGVQRNKDGVEDGNVKKNDGGVTVASDINGDGMSGGVSNSAMVQGAGA